MTAERMFVAAVMLVVGLVIGAFIADPAHGADYSPGLMEILDEAQSILDEAEALIEEGGDVTPEITAMVDEAETMMDGVRERLRGGEVQAPTPGGPGPMGLPVRRASFRSGYGPPPTTEDLMRGGELQPPAPGGDIVPLAAAPPSLEATGIEGVVVLVKPVEDLSGPLVYPLPQTPAEQWDDLPFMVQALLFFGVWALVLSLLMLITGRGLETYEAGLRRAAGRITPKRRDW